MQGSGLFHYVGSRDWTLSFGLNVDALYLLSHLAFSDFFVNSILIPTVFLRSARALKCAIPLAAFLSLVMGIRMPQPS